MPRSSASSARFARDQAHLHPEELVEREPAPRLAPVLARLRLVDVPVGLGAVHELELGPDVVRQRLLEVPGPLQREGNEGLQLPARDIGLARLRVDRHHDTGLRTGRVAEHVDDGIGELPLAAEDVELPVERELDPLGELLVAPRLVEEDEVEQPAAVLDDHLDHLLALASRARGDLAHLGHDRRLLAHLELGDLRLAGAVVVPARVVLEQIEHGLDRRRHQRELLEHSGAEAGYAVQGLLRQVAQGLGRARGYSTPIRYG